MSLVTLHRDSTQNFALPSESTVVGTYSGIMHEYYFVTKGENVLAYVKDKQAQTIVVVNLVAEKAFKDLLAVVQSGNLAKDLQIALQRGFYPILTHDQTVIFRQGLLGGMPPKKAEGESSSAIEPSSPRDWTQPILPPQTLEGHTKDVRVLIELKDGSLASGSEDSTIKIWNRSRGECLQTLEGHKGYVRTLIELKDRSLASGSNDHTIKIWNRSRGKCLQTLEGHTEWVHHLIELKDGSLASGSADRTIRIWDRSTGKCLRILEGHTSIVLTLIELKGGSLASGSMDNTIKIWDRSARQCLQTLKGHTHWVEILIELQDGSLASGSQDNTIKIWNRSRGECLQTLEGHKGWINTLIELKDGSLASGSYDKTIKIWNKSQRKCLQTLKGHKKWVYTLVELKDGSLASGSGDNTVKIWNKSRGKCLQTLKGHTGWVRHLIELKDGSLASGSDDHTIKIWDAKKLVQSSQPAVSPHSVVDQSSGAGPSSADEGEDLPTEEAESGSKEPPKEPLPQPSTSVETAEKPNIFSTQGPHSSQTIDQLQQQIAILSLLVEAVQMASASSPTSATSLLAPIAPPVSPNALTPEQQMEMFMRMQEMQKQMEEQQKLAEVQQKRKEAQQIKIASLEKKVAKKEDASEDSAGGGGKAQLQVEKGGMAKAKGSTGQDVEGRVESHEERLRYLEAQAAVHAEESGMQATRPLAADPKQKARLLRQEQPEEKDLL